MIAKPELLAPAGNLDCARAAVANGADAVYFGLPRFNARMRADNFTTEQLPELVRFLHDHRVRAICAFNTLVFTDELPEAERQLVMLDDLGVDAVLVQDLGLAVLARQLGVRFEVHASTQMTITSPAGVEFIRRLGINRVVLARETSLGEISRFGGRSDLPVATGSAESRSEDRSYRGAVELEVFVHGALCVAYSGQCLTSEALGQRSANRGECASACRLPYELIVDGAVKDLGDRRYLLSPQDLAAAREIPELIRLGVRAFKIEGRLKSPEYVAATCQVYRKAIDVCSGGSVNRRGEDRRFTEAPLQPEDWYKLEMTFSRGFTPGWLRGTNHAELVQGRFGTKRGPMVGRIKEVGYDFVAVEGAAVGLWERHSCRDRSGQECPSHGGSPGAVRPGDGVVFGETEQGGRVWEVKGDRLYFARGHIDFRRLTPGLPVWKTSDPQLERELRRTFTGKIPKPRTRLDFVVTGRAGEPLVITAGGGVATSPRPESNPDRGGDAAPTSSISLSSAMPLQTAVNRPLTTELLREQLGRLGDTDFELGELTNQLVGPVILPVSELNRLRREIVAALCERRERERIQIGGRRPPLQFRSRPEGRSYQTSPELIVLCRTMPQIEAAIGAGVGTVYVDFEDIRRYAEAVRMAKGQGARVVLATPRIEKAGEQGFFKVIEQAQPDGVLIRNLGGLEYFKARNGEEYGRTRRDGARYNGGAEERTRRDGARYNLVGDFSLNVANPVAAELLIGAGLERVTVGYDLNGAQVLDLLRAAPPEWFEIVVHQHLPMFHMEHCVFAAFLAAAPPHPDAAEPQVRGRARTPCAPPLGCRSGNGRHGVASLPAHRIYACLYDLTTKEPNPVAGTASPLGGEAGDADACRLASSAPGEGMGAKQVLNATNCGRPCDRHEVRLRDRVGAAHPVKADVGCRNTVFHARAQSGAEFVADFLAAGARVFRVELLDEDAARTGEIIGAYRELLAGRNEPAQRLAAVRQLGVTSGTLTVLGNR